MDLHELKGELVNDPLGRGYAGMTDQQAADDLNTVYREVGKDGIAGDTMYQSTDQAEWDGLTADQQSNWLSLCSRTVVDPFGQANVNLAISIFGLGSATITNLNSLRRETVSRAAELGWPTVQPGWITQARAL